MVTSLEKGRITNRQLLLAVVCFLSGSTMYSNLAIGITMQDTWFVSITGFAVGLLIAIMIIQLSKKFPDQTLVEINTSVFGKTGGKIVSFLYVFHLLNYVTWDTRDVGSFIHSLIIPETPVEVIYILFMLVCSYAVIKGITTIGRISFLIAAVIIITFAFNGILLTGYMDISNFYPMFSLPLKNYLYTTFLLSIIHFGGSYTFLMVFPFVKDRKKTAKYFYIGGFIGFLLFIFVVARDWAVAGQLTAILSNPSFQVLRIIDIAGVLTRLEVLFMIIFILASFYLTTIEYYALVLATAQLTGLKSYKNLVYVVAPIIVCYSLLIFTSDMEMSYFGVNVSPYYGAIFCAFLPGITLIIAKIKEVKKNKSLKRGIV